MDASNTMWTCADHELTTRVGGLAARVLRACRFTRDRSFAGQRVQRHAQAGFHTGRPSPWHKGRPVPLNCSIFASETKRCSEDSGATTFPAFARSKAFQQVLCQRPNGCGKCS
ncbi:hypothetical protein MRX96_004430 [Rhipicephalus microplus]